MMKICDRVAQVANEITPEPKLVLKYKKNHVALCTPGSFFNVMAFLPRSNFVLIRFRAADPAAWVTRSTDAGIVAELAKHGTRVAVRLRSGDVEQHQELLRELIHESIKEKRGSDSRNAGRETIHIHKCSEGAIGRPSRALAASSAVRMMIDSAGMKETTVEACYRERSCVSY